MIDLVSSDLRAIIHTHEYGVQSVKFFHNSTYYENHNNICIYCIYIYIKKKY